MASVRLNGDTSGFIEISAPNVAGSTTITLPATSGGNFLVTDSNGDLNVDSGTLFVDASINRVGIGTTSPGRSLEVSSADDVLIKATSTDAGAYIEFADNSTTQDVRLGAVGNAIAFDVNSERMRIDSSGRLLVGTTTARANFNNSTDTTHLQVEGTNANTSSLALICNSDGGVPVASLHLAKSDGTSVGSNGAVGGQWNVGDIRFSGNDGTQFVEAARIEAEIDGTPGADNMPGRLVFLTTLASGSSPTERARITNNGSFCIMSTDTSMNTFGTIFTPANNTSTQPAVLNFSKTHSGAVDAVVFRHNGSRKGSITFNDTSTTFTTSSDYRLKENVVDLEGAIDRVKQLAPKRFNFIDDPSETVDGFIAHEAQTVVPEAVIGVKDEVEVWQENETLPDGVSVGDNKLDEDGNTIPLPQGIDQSKLVPLLTAALQEAIGKIETLETANASLEARLTALEGGN